MYVNKAIQRANTVVLLPEHFLPTFLLFHLIMNHDLDVVCSGSLPSVPPSSAVSGYDLRIVCSVWPVADRCRLFGPARLFWDMTSV